MTISVKLFVPAGKRAKVTLNGITTYYDAAEHDIQVGAVHGEVSMQIEEVNAEPGATTQGGGNGNPPPKPPKGG